MSQQTITQQQQKLKSLLNKRHQLFQKIRQITKQQRLFSHQQNRQDDDYTGTVRKMIKKNEDDGHQSNLKIQSKSSIKHSEQKQQILSPQKQKNKEQKQPQANPAMKQRNKRMFSGLNMYLKKASSRLDAEKEKVQRDLQQLKNKIEIQESLIQKKKKQDEAFKEKKNKKLQEQRQETNKLKDQNAKQILECQNLLLRKKYSNYVNQFNPFIMTKTQPHIFWKPGKDNQKIKKLREQTKQELTKQETKVHNTIGQYSEVFSLGKFLAQNQQEYAANYLQRYFKNLQKNILTKTVPSIYWRPGSWNQKLREVQQSSIEVSNQEKSKLLTEYKHSFKQQQQHVFVMHEESSQQHQHSHEQSQ